MTGLNGRWPWPYPPNRTAGGPQPAGAGERQDATRFGQRMVSILRGRLRPPSQKVGEAFLRQPALGDGDHGVVEARGRLLDDEPVHLQEDDGGEHPGPLVPVEEGLVLRDVEGVGGGHREEVLVYA